MVLLMMKKGNKQLLEGQQTMSYTIALWECGSCCDAYFLAGDACRARAYLAGAPPLAYRLYIYLSSVEVCYARTTVALESVGFS